MNEYIIPHIQIRKNKSSQSRGKSLGSEPNYASLPDELSKKEEYSFEPINIQEIVSSEQDYIVVGESGIGKTSLLLWIGKQIALEGEKAKYIPLFIQIKDVSQIKIGNEFLSLLNTRYNLNQYEVKDRRYLFLLDGLDQIGEFGNIQDRLKRKDIFGERNKIILTTRPIGYEWVKKDIENRYEYLQIQPFDKEKIQEYIGRYFNDKRFQTILSQNNELLKVPILLKMVKALLLTNRLSEIRNRASLYEGFIRYLFEDWESAKKGRSSAYTSAIEIQKDLAELSFHAIENNYLGSFPLEKGYKYIGNDRNRLNDLISWSVIHNLIEKEGQKVIAYTHQSFQEYLASLCLKDKLCSNNRIDQEILEQCLEYKRWDETIVFTVGTLDDEMAKTLIEKIVKYDLCLAGLCLGEFKGKRSEFKGLINELLKNLEKEDAQNVLIKIADSELIEKLINLLNDANKDVIRRAVYILGGIGTEKVIDPLIVVLKDKHMDSVVRERAAYALGETGSEKVVELLISLLEDKNANTYARWCAANALGKIGSEKVVEHLISTLSDSDTDKDVRRSVADALGETGSEKAVKHLISILKNKDEDTDVHERAANALGKIGSEKAVEPLMSILSNSDTDKDVRMSVTYALGKIGSEKVVEPLISFLKDKNANTYARQCAAYALGKIGSEKAVEPLVLILSDSGTDKHVRMIAAYALGRIGSEKVVEHLISILKDKDTDVRRWAAEALGEIGSEKAVEPLISILKVKDWYVGRWSAYALGKIGSGKAVEPLISILKVKDWYVGRWAANALGIIGSEKAVEPLISILKDKDEDTDVHERAANALGKIGSEKTVEPLISILKDQNMDTYVHWIAARTLCEITKKLKEKEQDTLFACVYSLNFDNAWKKFLITQIKNVTARRFIKFCNLGKNTKRK